MTTDTTANASPLLAQLPRPLKPYLILCEGETEAGFFSALCEAWGLEANVCVHRYQGTHGFLVKTIPPVLQNFLRVALVYDHDAQEGAQQAFRDLSAYPNLLVCDSNPSFEVYFLACHKGALARYTKTVAELPEALPQHIALELLRRYDKGFAKGYEGGRRLFADYEGVLERGRKEMKQRRSAPHSFVYRLIEDLELILKMGRRLPEAGANPQPEITLERIPAILVSCAAVLESSAGRLAAVPKANGSEVSTVETLPH